MKNSQMIEYGAKGEMTFSEMSAKFLSNFFLYPHGFMIAVEAFGSRLITILVLYIFCHKGRITLLSSTRFSTHPRLPWTT